MSGSIEPTMNVSALADRRNDLETGELNLHRASVVVHAADGGAFSNAWRIVRGLFAEGRAVLRGSRAVEFAPASIEQELSRFLGGFPSGKVRCEVSVTGHRRKLKPDVREQIKLIGREALANALRHSGATCIEAEVEYSPRRVRLVVRDNGRGIEPGAACTRRDARWGLLGMRERAERIGAKLTVWSKPGAGTEVEISVSSQTLTDACA